jgi:putative MFS transporter
MAEVSAQDLLAELDQARLTPRYWATFALVVLQLICEIFDFFIVGFLVLAVAPKWGLSVAQTTIILLSAGLGAMFGALVFGWASDRYGRKLAVVGGAVVYCASAGAIALIPDGAWMLFALLRFMVGVGYGGAGSSQFALIAEYTPTRLRVLMTSSLGVPASLGVVLASVVVAQLLPAFGWRGLAALGATPILVAIGLAFIAPESPRWLAANGRGERARRALSAMLGRPVELAAATAPPPKVRFAEVLREPKRFWLIVLIQLGMGTAFSGVLLWGPIIVAQLLRVPPQKAASYFIWVSLAGLAGRFLFVVLPMKIGRVRSGWLLAYGGAVFLALAAVFHGDYLGLLPLFVVFLVIGQLFFDGGFSNINPYAVEVYPVRSAALGAGVASAAGGLGKIVGPLALGLFAGVGQMVKPAVIEHAILPGFLFLAACCLIAGLAYSLLGIETKGRPIVLE